MDESSYNQTVLTSTLVILAAWFAELLGHAHDQSLAIVCLSIAGLVYGVYSTFSTNMAVLRSTKRVAPWGWVLSYGATVMLATMAVGAICAKAVFA